MSIIALDLVLTLIWPPLAISQWVILFLQSIIPLHTSLRTQLTVAQLNDVLISCLNSQLTLIQDILSAPSILLEKDFPCSQPTDRPAPPDTCSQQPTTQRNSFEKLIEIIFISHSESLLDQAFWTWFSILGWRIFLVNHWLEQYLKIENYNSEMNWTQLL